MFISPDCRGLTLQLQLRSDYSCIEAVRGYSVRVWRFKVTTLWGRAAEDEVPCCVVDSKASYELQTIGSAERHIGDLDYK